MNLTNAWFCYNNQLTVTDGVDNYKIDNIDESRNMVCVHDVKKQYRMWLRPESLKRAANAKLMQD